MKFNCKLQFPWWFLKNMFSSTFLPNWNAQIAFICVEILRSENVLHGFYNLFAVLCKLCPTSVIACSNQCQTINGADLSHLLLYLLQAMTCQHGGTGHTCTVVKAQDIHSHHAQMFVGKILQAPTEQRILKCNYVLVLFCLSHFYFFRGSESLQFV